MNNEIYLLSYFRRSKEHSTPINATNHAGIKLSHDYLFRNSSDVSKFSLFEIKIFDRGNSNSNSQPKTGARTL